MAIDSVNYRNGIIDFVESEVNGAPSAVAKGNAFCRWCLENIFDLSSDQAIDAMEVSGAYDHSIDAFILDEESIAVVQTKYETSHDWSELTKFHYDMCRIRDGKTKPHELSANAQKLVVDIQDAYEMGWEVKFYYLTTNTFSPAERSKTDSLAGAKTEFFFWDMEYIAYKLETKLQEIPDNIKNKWFSLKLSSREILKFAHKTAVIAVNLSDMHDFVSEGGNELFSSNVRQYLRGTKINTGR